jgi:hypothetical protein
MTSAAELRRKRGAMHLRVRAPRHEDPRPVSAGPKQRVAREAKQSLGVEAEPRGPDRRRERGDDGGVLGAVQVRAEEERHVARRAADSGVVLGLEVVNRYETNLINTAEQAMAFLDDVNEPNVKVHLDSYHMNIEERSLRQAVLTCRDKLGYVHVGESHRGQLGTGTVDFVQLFYGLAEVGYEGPITFESFSSEVVSPRLSNTLCVWRDLWEDSDELAKGAKDYVERMIEAAAKVAGNKDVEMDDWF